MNEQQLTVIAETPQYLVVDKPVGLPTVPLKKQVDGSDTLLSRIAKEYPEVLSLGRNAWEGGIIHRLDTLTRGLVLVARTPECFDLLRREQESGMIVKEYLAQSSRNQKPPIGFPDYPYEDVTGGDVVAIGSLFRPFGEKRREVRPVSNDCPSSWKAKSTGVWYLTKVKQIGKEGDTHRFLCQLSIGFRHQVRAHLAWAGWALDGDANYRGISGKPFGLTAVTLRFPDPSSGKNVCYMLKETV